MGGAHADRQGHVIVCGLPGVGLRIVEQLTLSGVPAVVVDDDPEPPLARLIATWDVPLISGSTRAEETMMSAGLPGAIAVICAQHDDLHALETALLTRRLRADVRVVAQITTLSGMRFLAARTAAPRAASLRELYGALAPSPWSPRPAAASPSAQAATLR